MNEPLETIGDYDQLDPIVERLVEQPKDIRRTQYDQRRNSFTLTAKLRGRSTREVLLLDIRFHGRRGSQVQAVLKRRDGTILRLWHYHRSQHLNPDGSQVELTHKHFPTIEHPIREMDHRGTPTWAYSTYDINPEEIINIVEGFAQE